MYPPNATVHVLISFSITITGYDSDRFQPLWGQYSVQDHVKVLERLYSGSVARCSSAGADARDLQRSKVKGKVKVKYLQ
jgi:hypothetical protein